MDANKYRSFLESFDLEALLSFFKGQAIKHRVRRGSSSPYRHTAGGDMNKHRDWKVILCFGLLFLLISVAVCWMAQQVPLPAVFAQDPQAEIECAAYCSSIRPGVSYLEVRWRIAAQRLTDAELREQVGKQKLDVTVYANGYDEGNFVRLDAVRPKALFRSMADGSARAGRRGRPLPGLNKLRLSDISTRVTRPAADTMRLPITPAGPEWVVVRLEGVAPGMEYTFRVPGRQAIATCAAVVCPVDSPRRASTKPKVARPRPGY